MGTTTASMPACSQYGFWIIGALKAWVGDPIGAISAVVLRIIASPSHHAHCQERRLATQHSQATEDASGRASRDLYIGLCCMSIQYSVPRVFAAHTPFAVAPRRQQEHPMRYAHLRYTYRPSRYDAPRWLRRIWAWL